MLKFISLEESFDIYEVNFSIVTDSPTVRSEVYIVSPNIGDIDGLMKRCEEVSTFLISKPEGNDLVFSGYELSEIYPKGEDEIVIIFAKEG